MKILHAVPDMLLGSGVSASIFSASEAMVHKGHRVFIIAESIDGIYQEKLRKRGISFFFAPLSQRKKSIANFFGSIRAIGQAIREKDIDLVHSHHRWNCVMATLSARCASLPSVTSDHNILFGLKNFSFWADGIITDSPYNKQHLMSYFGVPESKIKIVPPLIEKERYDQLVSGDFRRNHKQGEFEKLKENNRFLIGKVARLSNEKGHEFLLDVAEEVIREDARVRFAFLGEGPLREKLLDRVHKTGFSDHIKFLGLRPNPFGLLASLDLFVVASKIEGFCMASAEAILTGLPVIATKVGGLVDQVTDGESGFLVDYGDRRTFKNRILQIISSRETARRMGQIGKSNYLKHYSYSLVADQLEKAYLFFLNSRGQGAEQRVSAV